MTENCVFCKIVKGEIPCYKIYEDEETLGFLDAFPSMKGQSIIIPKKHIAPWLFDTDDETYTKLMLAAKKVAKAVDSTVNPVKTGLVVEGLELEHVHIKIFPFSENGFKDYTTTKNLNKEEMQEIAEKIRNNF